jgi:hypothetical protein
VDQGRRLEGVPGAFLGHLAAGHGPELVVNEGEEVFGGLGLALLDALEEAGEGRCGGGWGAHGTPLRLGTPLGLGLIFWRGRA